MLRIATLILLISISFSAHSYEEGEFRLGAMAGSVLSGSNPLNIGLTTGYFFGDTLVFEADALYSSNAGSTIIELDFLMQHYFITSSALYAYWAAGLSVLVGGTGNLGGIGSLGIDFDLGANFMGGFQFRYNYIFATSGGDVSGFIRLAYVFEN